MKLTAKKLKQMILQEMARIPAHIPTTDPETERKVADLLTREAADVKQASALLEPANLTIGVKEDSREEYQHGQTNVKVTDYHFKVTQSFYDAILDQLKAKRRTAQSNLANVIGEWTDGDAKIVIRVPYNLVMNNKYRDIILRSDEPYVEHVQVTITEPVG